MAKKIIWVKKGPCVDGQEHSFAPKQREGIDSWYDQCTVCGEIGTAVDDRMDLQKFIEMAKMSEHKGLRDLHTQVTRGDFGWDRWGLLRCLSDFVLNFSQGDILEIGCGETSIHFSRLAEMYGRKCYHVDFSKSGIENMQNTPGYFGSNSQVFNMKSDDFFASLRNADIGYPKLAIAFIDGDHIYEAAKRDFDNVFPFVLPTGMIFLHDTYPRTEDWTVEHRCGTVYKLRHELEARNDIDVFTFTRTAFDVGLTMVRKREPNAI